MPLNTSVVEIRPDSPTHTKIISMFQEHCRIAEAGVARRSVKWAENEDMLKAYVKPSENDQSRAVARKSEGRPDYTTIEVPYSYAMMLSLHTYLTSIFLSRSPILQLNGRHGESQQAEQCVEALLDYQIQIGGAIPYFYVWMLDPLRYGQGIIGHFWDAEMTSTTQFVEKPMEFLGMPIPGTTKRRAETIQLKGYEGARFYNVRPQDFLFDPRVPLMHFQDGEFVIRYNELSWNQIVKGQQAGNYYNIDQARTQGFTGNSNRDLGSPRTTLPGNGQLEIPTQMRDGTPTRMRLHEYYVELIPRDYGLSPNEYPEKWVFTVVNKKLIIGAQPLGLYSNKWPFDVLEYEIGGYEVHNRSALEITKTLNDTITWLFNSHFYNVRKTLNDQFVVDPSMIEMRDMTNPNPGRLIRLKPAAWGKGVDAAVKQLASVDITRSHMADLEAVGQVMQRITGGTDNVMGMVNTGGRKTATEVRSSTSFGVNKLKTIAEWWSATGWGPMTQKLIQLQQQMYQDERKYRVVGDQLQWGQKYVDVTPDQIAGFYDFTPVDGTLPIDRFAQANLWQQIFAGLAKMPNVMAAYDMPKMFAFVAQLAGLKNITQFRIQVTPDAQIQQQAQAGNLQPIAPGNPNEPGQIPNMGATG